MAKPFPSLPSQRPQLFSPLCALEADVQRLTIFVALTLRITAPLLQRVLHAIAPFGLLEGQQACLRVFFQFGRKKDVTLFLRALTEL